MSLTLGGTDVERVTTFKLLGVYIFDDRKWARHVDVSVIIRLVFSVEHRLVTDIQTDTRADGTGPQRTLTQS